MLRLTQILFNIGKLYIVQILPIIKYYWELWLWCYAGTLYEIKMTHVHNYVFRII